MVEARSKGTIDWILGNDTGKPVRSFIDPSYFDHPKKMSEYVFTTLDFGGVHINSSIINHIFYQLAEKLPGAIGIHDAEQIFYRTLTTKLLPKSQFIDARLGAIASAEELFGVNSIQVNKTIEAFDRAEIFDNSPTPEPVQLPEINSPDSTLRVFFDSTSQAYVLVRREQTLNDPQQGTLLSRVSVAPKRLSVSGDGSLAVFVNSQNDVCYILTDGTEPETCLGFPGQVFSVALSPDKRLIAFVLLDNQRQPKNSITLYNTLNETNQTFTLQSPLIDGGTIDVTQADVMDFSSDSKSLVYDAFNSIRFTNGSSLGLWSIYKLEIEKGRVTVDVPPTRGINIGNPALAQTNDNFLTFEAFYPTTGKNEIIAMNWATNQAKLIDSFQLQPTNFFGTPSYTGNDLAIVYTIPDSTTSAHSLAFKSLNTDHITPNSQRSLWLRNGAFGVVYRRGEFSGPENFNLNISLKGNGSGLVSSSPSGIICGKNCSEDFLQNTTVSLVANPSPGSVFSGWSGASCSGTGSCKITINGNQSVTAEFSSSEFSPINNDLKIRAIIETEEKGEIQAIWSKGGEANTARGDKVIWGHFYASPSDVSWGSSENPDLFVKIWFDVSGRIDVNYFHVSVPRIQVHTAFSNNASEPDQSGKTDMSRRYIRHFMDPNGTSFAEENFEDGVSPALDLFAPAPVGFNTLNNIKIGTQINTVEVGFLEGDWQFGGSSKTARGDEVVWGHFSADPGMVSWGNLDNPEIFVKIWFDVSGRIDVNYFHVSVPDIGVFSDNSNDSLYDQQGVTILQDRYTRHEFHQ